MLANVCTIGTRLFHSSINSLAPLPLAYTKLISSPSFTSKNSPLVIVHGLFGQKEDWNSMGSILHQKLDAPVFAVDVRNHGASPHANSMSYTEMAEDVAAAIDKIRDETKAQRINLLGHSMGGKVVMRVAIDPQWCDRIEKLIVEDVSPIGYKRRHVKFSELIKTMKTVNIRRPFPEIEAELLKVIPDETIRQFISSNIRKSSRNLNEMEWKFNIDVIETHVAGLLGYTLPTGYFYGPTLFLHSQKSGYVPEDHKAVIINHFPLVEFEKIDKAGHWIHNDQPEMFAEGVANFLKKPLVQ